MDNTPPEAYERAVRLVDEAKKQANSGHLEQATQSLREASAIAPEHPGLRSAWEELQGSSEDGHQSPLSRLCKSWAHLGDDAQQHGEAALNFIKTHELSPRLAQQAFGIISTTSVPASTQFIMATVMSDQLHGALLANTASRSLLALQMKAQPTMTFRKYWDRGDESVDGLIATLLDQAAWPSENTRIEAERDVFQLSLAEMMDAGVDTPERAMKAIARLLALESSHLNGIIDVDGFDVILSSLDVRLPAALRSQASLALAKLVELSPDNAQSMIARYVRSKTDMPNIENLTKAFSAAAAVFPLSPQAASTLFMSEGFLPSFARIVEKKSSQRLEQAALELLNSACMNKDCREGIARHCREWLETVAATSPDAKRSNLAALVLVKINDDMEIDPERSTIRGDSFGDGAFVSQFKSMLFSSDDQDSLEGLAYASLKPKVKEELANDGKFLTRLIGLMSNARSGKSLLFGGLTIFANLTSYLPAMSDEQKKISQLKAYANTQKPSEPDPLDDDKHATARCHKVLEAGILPLLVLRSRKATPTNLTLIIQILFCLSKEQKNRGLLAQQGSVKLLLQIHDRISQDPSSTSASTSIALRTSAHALARILISVNPSHVFGSSNMPLTSAIRPLCTLLTEDSHAEHRDLLPTFEALLALTNLASTDDEARETIIRLTWSQLENLILSNNTMIQRATVELICNLSASPHGVAKYADGSKAASNRLHILLALADVDDVATRRAAGGALAMLTEWDQAVQAILERANGVKLLLGMCEDEDEGVQMRGTVCVKNVVSAPGDIGQKGLQMVKEAGGVEILEKALSAQ
ncbi:CRO1 protein [Aulographum hederae CBS 113979]|uniref:CRO1 protein n=1 Tax=Aulographum hederae CBS 113979 TaxID=1176131 RepID=A0A6G1GV75_9PEZI|nr:CRO1 protein [Aulographum hederae CBS 113979]